jgi:hypothetical protein
LDGHRRANRHNEDLDERLPPTGDSTNTNTNTTNTSATIILLPPSRHGMKLASLSAVYFESEEDDPNAERGTIPSFSFFVVVAFEVRLARRLAFLERAGAFWC